jgi:hypothetical protein
MSISSQRTKALSPELRRRVHSQPDRLTAGPHEKPRFYSSDESVTIPDRFAERLGCGWGDPVSLDQLFER